MRTILIADSGSTKTDWCLLKPNGTTVSVQTKGLNPFQMTEEEITEEIVATLLPSLGMESVDRVYFYGAGCTPEKQPLVERALRRSLSITVRCEVAGDMLGAARGICGHKAGIACILGTGSNSCAFDGKNITHNVSPLGFILGDEGSGAVLGRTLVADILKNQMPRHIAARFQDKYHLTAADIVERVYRQKLPNRFLAGFAPFLKENIDEPCIKSLVEDGFRRFLCRNVKQYEGWNRLPIGFNGSIATVFRAQLENVIRAEGMHLGRIIKTPMEGLVAFHRQQD